MDIKRKQTSESIIQMDLQRTDVKKKYLFFLEQVLIRYSDQYVQGNNYVCYVLIRYLLSLRKKKRQQGNIFQETLNLYEQYLCFQKKLLDRKGYIDYPLLRDIFCKIHKLPELDNQNIEDEQNIQNLIKFSDFIRYILLVSIDQNNIRSIENVRHMKEIIQSDKGFYSIFDRYLKKINY